MSWVLDTTFLIDLARRDAGAVEWLERARDAGGNLLIPSVAAAEYLTGSRAPAEDLEAMASAGDIVSFGVPEATAAATLAREALAAGRFPGWSDVFIAATAVARGVPLVTRDSKSIAGVRRETY